MSTDETKPGTLKMLGDLEAHVFHGVRGVKEVAASLPPEAGAAQSELIDIGDDLSELLGRIRNLRMVLATTPPRLAGDALPYATPTAEVG